MNYYYSTALFDPDFTRQNRETGQMHVGPTRRHDHHGWQKPVFVPLPRGIQRGRKDSGPRGFRVQQRREFQGLVRRRKHTFLLESIRLKPMTCLTTDISVISRV